MLKRHCPTLRPTPTQNIYLTQLVGLGSAMIFQVKLEEYGFHLLIFLKNLQGEDLVQSMVTRNLSSIPPITLYRQYPALWT